MSAKPAPDDGITDATEAIQARIDAQRKPAPYSAASLVEAIERVGIESLCSTSAFQGGAEQAWTTILASLKLAASMESKPAPDVAELVKRLRNWADDGDRRGPLSHHKDIQFEAADRIEALEAALRDVLPMAEANIRALAIARGDKAVEAFASKVDKARGLL